MIGFIGLGNGKPNLRILEVTEIKTVPYVPLSHPFVERLIGTIRRKCLDRTLFWTSVDLENKLLDFRTYFNAHPCLPGGANALSTRVPTHRQSPVPSMATPLSRLVSDPDRCLMNRRLFLLLVGDELGQVTRPETIRCLSL